MIKTLLGREILIGREIDGHLLIIHGGEILHAAYATNSI